MTSLSVEKLYERYEMLKEAIENETTNEFSKEYEDIIETGSRGGHDEKLLAIPFISEFFRFYPHLQLRAIDALFDCCQDDNMNIRIIAMKALPSLCKSAEEHTMKVAGILSQLLQWEDTQKHLITALRELIKIHPVVAIKGFFKQVDSGEDKVQEKCIKFIKEKFLSPGSSVITKDVQDFIRSHIEVLEAGGSMLKAEHPEKEEIHSQTGYNEQIKKSRQSQEQDLQPQLDDGPGLKHQTETLSKQEEVKNKLRKFVEDFVYLYEISLFEYYVNLKNQITKPAKWANLVNKVSEIGTSGSEGIEVAGVKASTMVAINILQSIISSKGTMLNRDHFKKLIDKLTKFNEYPEGGREELVKSGVEIFRSFESQFSQATVDGFWERAMKKLAHDAVNRAINYHKEHSDEEFSASSITKGVLLGESKTYKHTSTGFPHVYSGHTLQDTWNTAKLFDNTGLVTIKRDGSVNKYYKTKGKNSETSKYGYRLLFEWESEDPLELKKKKYEEENPPQEEYKYILRPNEKENLERDILDNMNKHCPKVMEENLKENFKKEIKQIKEDAQKGFKKVEKYVSNNFTDLLSYIEEHQDEIKDIFKRIVQQNERHHQEASRQREEIATNNTDELKKVQEVLESVNQGINTLQKEQEHIRNEIGKIGSKNQVKKSI